MDNWFTDTKTDCPMSFYTAKVKPNFCGTSACIAGTVAANLTKDLEPTLIKDIGAWESCECYAVGIDIEELAGMPYHNRDSTIAHAETIEESKEIGAMRYCLEKIFVSPIVYGRTRLAAITKTEAIGNLREWAEVESWDELSNILEKKLQVNHD